LFRGILALRVRTTRQLLMKTLVTAPGRGLPKKRKRGSNKATIFYSFKQDKATYIFPGYTGLKKCKLRKKTHTEYGTKAITAALARTEGLLRGTSLFKAVTVKITRNSPRLTILPRHLFM